jgi:hypothetical protein
MLAGVGVIRRKVIMTVKEKLINEIEQAPEILLEEFLDFILFAKTRRNDRSSSSTPQTNKHIWEIAEELVRDMPPEVLATLPVDGAEQHDRYLYGIPKPEA